MYPVGGGGKKSNFKGDAGEQVVIKSATKVSAQQSKDIMDSLVAELDSSKNLDHIQSSKQLAEDLSKAPALSKEQ